MHIRRGYLFWGSFFILLGAVPLAVRELNLDNSRFSTADALWPLALIVAGALLLLSRSRLNALAVLVAGVVLGALAGTAIAGGSAGLLGIVGCDSRGSGDLPHVTRNGTFQGDASMTLDLSCGSLQLQPVAGSDWAVDAGYRGSAPSIDAAPTKLDVHSPDGVFQHQEWTVSLPTAAVHELDIQLNAGTSTLALGDSTLRNVNLQGNAADVQVDATQAAIGDLQLETNAGRARVTLGSSVTDGRLSVNAGSIDLCVAGNAAVSLQVAENLTFAINLGGSGLTRQGNTWTRPGTGGPTIHLNVEGNAASFNLNPAGGCK